MISMAKTNPRVERGTAFIDRRTARLGSINAALILIGAIVTGVVTLTPTLIAINNRDATIAALEQERDQLAGENEAAQQTIESLRADNLELLLALPPTVDPVDVPMLRLVREGLVLTSDFHFDLASGSPDLGQSQYPTGQDDVGYSNGSLTFQWQVAWVRTAGEAASYASCAYLTGWRTDRRLDATILRASDICLRLASGRFATIVVTDIQNDAVTFDVIVWEEQD
jgi:hypothetical protein